MKDLRTLLEEIVLNEMEALITTKQDYENHGDSYQEFLYDTNDDRSLLEHHLDLLRLAIEADDVFILYHTGEFEFSYNMNGFERKDLVYYRYLPDYLSRF